MNWETIQGNWKQYVGKVKEQWGKLTEDDIQQVEGKKDQLIGTLQSRYSIAKSEAEKEVDRFAEKLSI